MFAKFDCLKDLLLWKLYKIYNRAVEIIELINISKYSIDGFRDIILHCDGMSRNRPKQLLLSLSHKTGHKGNPIRPAGDFSLGLKFL